ncbi:hypothetical protein LEP1GSC185_2321 [Leptospira licerasiae serovar Varillal str. VAR 010]|uniref:Uncharacterized protein n=1 Tax=Leptospira licerasiae str. MMD4847 TaxID=1049971 RepID=A0ABP2R8J3_9LEPT|nr:hypothetical protein LEP1GSC185_2321 [Leptospira licerasiae serovar Varillal str. VAR 010]EJZ40665.1 hypothetical protein LEP1GSC178_1595 [Leptospira licerasiae str. MMD4847]
MPFYPQISVTDRKTARRPKYKIDSASQTVFIEILQISLFYILKSTASM